MAAVRRARPASTCDVVVVRRCAAQPRTAADRGAGARQGRALASSRSSCSPRSASTSSCRGRRRGRSRSGAARRRSAASRSGRSRRARRPSSRAARGCPRSVRSPRRPRSCALCAASVDAGGTALVLHEAASLRDGVAARCPRVRRRRAGGRPRGRDQRRGARRASSAAGALSRPPGPVGAAHLHRGSRRGRRGPRRLRPLGLTAGPAQARWLRTCSCLVRFSARWAHGRGWRRGRAEHPGAALPETGLLRLRPGQRARAAAAAAMPTAPTTAPRRRGRVHPWPEHDNGLGYLNGGIISTVLDCHRRRGRDPRGRAPRAGRRCPGTALPYVTAGLEVRYLRPTPLHGASDPARARGLSRPSSEMTAEVELVVDEKVRAVATALWKRWRPR